MPSYDSVVTRRPCVNGHVRTVEVQYGYGPVRYRQHRLGYEIDWALPGSELIGSPMDRAVRVLAEVAYHDVENGEFSFHCPDCGAPYERAVVEIRDGVISEVRDAAEGEVAALMANGDLCVDR